MQSKKWAKIIKLIIAILSVIGSFLGGQATAENGHIDLFNKCKIQKIK